VIKLLQVLSVMKCPAYSIMNIVWRSVRFLQVRTEEVWQKIMQELRQCGCLWWHFEVLLWSSGSDVCKLLCLTQYVLVVLPFEHQEKCCFIVPSFEAGTVLLLEMCCHFIGWNIWDGFCVIGCGIYVQFRKLVVGYMYSLDNWLWDICTV